MSRADDLSYDYVSNSVCLKKIKILFQQATRALTSEGNIYLSDNENRQEKSQPLEMKIEWASRQRQIQKESISFDLKQE